mgnify:CR=1 FL=1
MMKRMWFDAVYLEALPDLPDLPDLPELASPIQCG